MAALFCGMLEHRDALPGLIPSEFCHDRFKFAIICAGFVSRASAHQPLVEKMVHTPSLHLIGELDTLIAPERMMALTERFHQPQIFKHAGG
jgi:hypothetical protein